MHSFIDMLEGGCSLNEMDLAIHWLELKAQLPIEGVTRHFGTEQARLDRLEEILWGGRRVCPNCASDEHGYLQTRHLYWCKSCQFQFTVISQSPLRGTHLSLETWFGLVERIIDAHARSKTRVLLTNHRLMTDFAVSYRIASRTKAKLIQGLLEEGGGFWGKLVSTQAVELPNGVQRGSEEHRSRLQEIVTPR